MFHCQAETLKCSSVCELKCAYWVCWPPCSGPGLTPGPGTSLDLGQRRGELGELEQKKNKLKFNVSYPNHKCQCKPSSVACLGFISQILSLFFCCCIFFFHASSSIGYCSKSLAYIKHIWMASTLSTVSRTKTSRCTTCCFFRWHQVSEGGQVSDCLNIWWRFKNTLLEVLDYSQFVCCGVHTIGHIVIPCRISGQNWKYHTHTHTHNVIFRNTKQ